ncbi:MAG: DUF4190 domain-containing protein [Micrococcales bacterium]
MAETKSTGFDYSKLNSLAVVAFALSVGWVGAVAGVITGHFALAQIKRSGQRGRRLAITALIVGYTYIGLSLLWGMFMFGLALRGLIDYRGMNGMGHMGNFGDDRWGMMGGIRPDQGGLTPIQPLDPGTATAEPGQVNP